MVDQSEPLATRPGNAILRWVLAPFGAAAALGFGFFAPFLAFVLVYGAEMKNRQSAPAIACFAMAAMCGFVAWTWAGSRIAPLSHRRLATLVFSAPVGFLALVFLAAIRLGDEPPSTAIALTVGSVLACIGIAVLAFHPRFALAGDQRMSPGAIDSPLPSQPRSYPLPSEPSRSENWNRAVAVPDISEPRRPTLAGPILRWVFGPVGAAAASVFVFTILYQLSVFSLGTEAMKAGGSADFVVVPLVTCSVIAWAWVGACIAPSRHRRLAFALFAAPAALFAVFFLLSSLLALFSGLLFLGRFFIGVGCVLGCGVIWAIASHERYDVPLAERFENYVSSEYGPSQPQRSQPVGAPLRAQAAPAVATSFGTRNRSASQASRGVMTSSNQLTKRTLRELIDPTNQSAVAADLEAFLGPNGEIYLNHYGRMVRGQKTLPLSWNWPGFLTGYVWFFYRRMHLFGFMLLILPIILALVLPRATAAVSGQIALIAIGGALSKSIYVRHAFRHILKANEMNLVDDQRVLRSKGGVSRVAATFAGLILAITFVAGFLVGLSLGMDHGQLPRVRNA